MGAEAAPLPAAERGKVAPSKLAHIVLRSPDADRLAEWYCTVLEAEVVLANPFIKFLSYDDEHHRIAIAQFPGISQPPPMAAGLEHIAFTYANPTDLFSTYERLKEVGIEPYWTINHGPTISFYYRDPDGNQIELQIDVFPDVASVNRWLHSSDFSSNPIGVKFDPVDVLRRFRAGEDPDTLFIRPRIDPATVFAQLP